MAEIYSGIGCHRKAWFFQELAYRRYTSDASKPHTSWKQCYQLLLQMLPEHKLPLDPNHYVSGDRVRSIPLQLEVTNEILLASMKAESVSSATTHYTCLIQTMWWMIDKI